MRPPSTPRSRRTSRGVSAASVTHVLEQRRRNGPEPLLIDLVLPLDPGVRDLPSRPHALSTYDTPLTPPQAADEETPDDATR